MAWQYGSPPINGPQASPQRGPPQRSVSLNITTESGISPAPQPASQGANSIPAMTTTNPGQQQQMGPRGWMPPPFNPPGPQYQDSGGFLQPGSPQDYPRPPSPNGPGQGNNPPLNQYRSMENLPRVQEGGNPYPQQPPSGPQNMYAGPGNVAQPTSVGIPQQQPVPQNPAPRRPPPQAGQPSQSGAPHPQPGNQGYSSGPSQPPPQQQPQQVYFPTTFQQPSNPSSVQPHAQPTDHGAQPPPQGYVPQFSSQNFSSPPRQQSHPPPQGRGTPPPAQNRVPRATQTSPRPQELPPLQSHPFPVRGNQGYSRPQQVAQFLPQQPNTSWQQPGTQGQPQQVRPNYQVQGSGVPGGHLSQQQGPPEPPPSSTLNAANRPPPQQQSSWPPPPNQPGVNRGVPPQQPPPSWPQNQTGGAQGPAAPSEHPTSHPSPAQSQNQRTPDQSDLRRRPPNESPQSPVMSHAPPRGNSPDMYVDTQLRRSPSPSEPQTATRTIQFGVQPNRTLTIPVTRPRSVSQGNDSIHPGSLTSFQSPVQQPYQGVPPGTQTSPSNIGSPTQPHHPSFSGYTGLLMSVPQQYAQAGPPSAQYNYRVPQPSDPNPPQAPRHNPFNYRPNLAPVLAPPSQAPQTLFQPGPQQGPPTSENIQSSQFAPGTAPTHSMINYRPHPAEQGQQPLQQLPPQGPPPALGQFHPLPPPHTYATPQVPFPFENPPYGAPLANQPGRPPSPSVAPPAYTQVRAAPSQYKGANPANQTPYQPPNQHENPTPGNSQEMKSSGSLRHEHVPIQAQNPSSPPLSPPPSGEPLPVESSGSQSLPSIRRLPQVAESEPPIPKKTYEQVTKEFPDLLDKKDDPIGGGGYGQVFKIRHYQSPDKMTALKLMENKDRQSSERQRGELRLVRKYLINSVNQDRKHPNIVRIMDAFEIEKSRMWGSYLAIHMELCEDNLEYFLRQRKDEGTNLEASQIYCILMQILSGLQFCHEQGFAHRDLKPANVLYTMEGCNEHPEESNKRFLLTDFGLSRPVDDDKSGISSGRCGTGGYRAPEVFEGRYGKRTDMFSFGCVMMDVATTGRQRAFKEDYEIRRYKEEDPKYPLPLLRAGWDTGLDDLTLRSFNKWFRECLDRIPRARPRAADLLAKMAKRFKEATED